MGSLALLSAQAGGCSSGERHRDPDEVPGSRLTIYSSQPLSGALGDRARDMVRAERLALDQSGGRAGRWRLSYVPLDNADPRTGSWDPGLVATNARRAAQDATTIAYLGEMDSGGSAISIPILNDAGILTVSPLDGVAGLTRRRGAGHGEPEKYYPTHRRTFARLVPSDDVQAAALVSYMQDLRVRRLFILHDDSLYGGSLAVNVARRARPAGIRVLVNREIDPLRARRPALAAEMAAPRADALLYTGVLRPGVTGLLRALHAALPRLRLFAPSALANPMFAAGLGAAQGRIHLTAPALPPHLLAPASSRFRDRFRAAYGSPPDPFAVYGYEAMNAVIDSIRNAGAEANHRRQVVRSLFATARLRSSPLGTYSLDRLGDTSIQTFGSYRVRRGRLVFDRVLDPLGA